MWEMAIVILTVLAAATGVGYGVYRSVSGKAGCGRLSCGQPPDAEDIVRHGESK